MNNNNNLPVIQRQLNSVSIRQRIESRLGDKTGTFITSVLDLCGEDKNLAKCDPMLVVKEAMKAAALDLPINKNLGFAYIIPYKNQPAFQMGYKGYIQLAIRTGQYKHLNAGLVYEGETVQFDRIKGIMTITGERKSDKVTDYFSYMMLINGFEKAICCTKKQIEEHRNKFSKSAKMSGSAWKTDFDAMAMKTMILKLIPKYGPMTIEMSTAISSETNHESTVSSEISQNANTENLDFEEIPEAELEKMAQDEQIIDDIDPNANPGF